MTYEMNSFHIYYADLDRLLIYGLEPLIKTLKHGHKVSLIQRYFWERHYAGGAHLRLHLGVAFDKLQRVHTIIEEQMDTFFQQHPSEDDTGYNPKVVAELLEMEQEDPEEHDLTYRNHQVVRQPYRRSSDKFTGDAPIKLMEAFYEDAHDLLMQILRHPQGKELQMLKIFFLNAWLDNCTWANAGISYRSHWEGFKMQMQMRDANSFVESIESKQEQLEEHLLDIMDSCRYERRTQDPIMAAYEQLSRKYRKTAREMLERGEQLFHNFDPSHNHKYLEEVAEKHQLSDFVKELHYSDYLMKATQQLGFNVVRASTNLMYLLIPALGLAPYHKFKLGYFTFRTIEQHSGEDTHDMLRDNFTYMGMHRPSGDAPRFERT